MSNAQEIAERLCGTRQGAPKMDADTRADFDDLVARCTGPCRLWVEAWEVDSDGACRSCGLPEG